LPDPDGKLGEQIETSRSGNADHQEGCDHPDPPVGAGVQTMDSVQNLLPEPV
jgi:hypothetical protein